MYDVVSLSSIDVVIGSVVVELMLSSDPAVMVCLLPRAEDPVSSAGLVLVASCMVIDDGLVEPLVVEL